LGEQIERKRVDGRHPEACDRDRLLAEPNAQATGEQDDGDRDPGADELMMLLNTSATFELTKIHPVAVNS
jgi:hypothetical protein